MTVNKKIGILENMLSQYATEKADLQNIINNLSNSNVESTLLTLNVLIDKYRELIKTTDENNKKLIKLIREQKILDRKYKRKLDSRKFH